MNMQTSVYNIPGMDCPVEESLVREKLAKLQGIEKQSFNLVQRKLTVIHKAGMQQEITDALVSLGMGAAPDSGMQPEHRETPIKWKKLAVAGVFAFLSEMFDLFQEWHIFSATNADIAGISAYTLFAFLFAAATIILAGLKTCKKGLTAIKNFSLNINALMAVAVIAAVLIGKYAEAATVIVLFELSEAIEAKSLERARGAIKKLMALAPEMATVKTDNGEWAEMPAAKVPVNSLVRVRPGEKIALDGKITHGSSAINQASITGESMPVEKKEGDAVYAGTINETGSFEYITTATSDNSALAKIIHAVENAQATRAPVQRFVDIFAKYYTPAIFAFAMFLAFVPPLFFGGSFYDSVYKSLVILIIGCPCALVISTPVSVVSGMARAAASGILVKGGVFMEQGRLIKWLALDKTGTITSGKPKLVKIVPFQGKTEKEVLEIAFALAKRSDHPVSKAIAEYGKCEKKFEAGNFKALPGLGIKGEIAGAEWQLGNLRMANEKIDEQIKNTALDLEKTGKTVIALFEGKKIMALFAVADTIREGSAEAIKELQKLGVTPVMLTGDNEFTAYAIAKEAGIEEFKAGLLPEDKLKFIESLEKRKGKTGMAGDGINDAPALAKADISFAMAKEGTDTAMETADVALMDDDLRKIPRFMRLSRATFAILAENIAISLAIKAIFFVLALSGIATMWMAVFADVGAALIVVGNGLRILKK